MTSKIFGATNGTPSTSAVNYTSIMACLGSTPTSTETARLGVVPAAFTLKNFYISINTAPGTLGSGKQYVFTIRKNQVDTGITVTLLETATSGAYAGAGVSFAAGDTISLSMTPTGTPTAPTLLMWNLDAVSVSTHFAQLLGGSETTTNLSTTAVTYAQLTGITNSANGWNATEAVQEIICPCNGMISNLYAVSDTAPGTGKSYAIALVQNGMTTSLSALVSGTNKTGNDTTHSITVSDGDTLSIAATPTSTPAIGRYAWGLQFTPTTPGESFFGFGNLNAPSTTSTQYEIPLGIGANSWSTETTRQVAVGACTLQNIYAAIGTAPGSGKSRTLTVRRNQVSQPLSVAITNTNVSGNSTGAVGLVQSDLISLEAAESGTPAVDTNGVHVGVKVFIPVSTVTSGNALLLME